jgi:hypothetical protein
MKITLSRGGAPEHQNVCSEYLADVETEPINRL